MKQAFYVNKTITKTLGLQEPHSTTLNSVSNTAKSYFSATQSGSVKQSFLVCIAAFWLTSADVWLPSLRRDLRLASASLALKRWIPSWSTSTATTLDTTNSTSIFSLHWCVLPICYIAKSIQASPYGIKEYCKAVQIPLCVCVCLTAGQTWYVTDVPQCQWTKWGEPRGRSCLKCWKVKLSKTYLKCTQRLVTNWRIFVNVMRQKDV